MPWLRGTMAALGGDPSSTPIMLGYKVNLICWALPAQLPMRRGGQAYQQNGDRTGPERRAWLVSFVAQGQGHSRIRLQRVRGNSARAGGGRRALQASTGPRTPGLPCTS